ncbi:MAG: translation elongation factor Ts [Chloroflexi bacterium]|nr:translation elongation factor Ts [Chloroflexota bacterium]
MAVTAAMVKELRDRTGAGVMDAKKALEQADGDQSKAEELLKEHGLADAAKRAGRETSEGLVQSYIHPGSRIGTLVEVNCETDFVARTDEFQELTKSLAMQIAAMSPKYIDRDSVPDDEENVPDEEVLLTQAYIRDPSISVNELIQQVNAKTGENIKIRRFERFALGE